MSITDFLHGWFTLSWVERKAVAVRNRKCISPSPADPTTSTATLHIRVLPPQSGDGIMQGTRSIINNEFAILPLHIPVKHVCCLHCNVIAYRPPSNDHAWNASHLEGACEVDALTSYSLISHESSVTT